MEILYGLNELLLLMYIEQGMALEVQFVCHINSTQSRLFDCLRLALHHTPVASLGSHPTSSLPLCICLVALSVHPQVLSPLSSAVIRSLVLWPLPIIHLDCRAELVTARNLDPMTTHCSAEDGKMGDDSLLSVLGCFGGLHCIFVCPKLFFKIHTYTGIHLSIGQLGHDKYVWQSQKSFLPATAQGLCQDNPPGHILSLCMDTLLKAPQTSFTTIFFSKCC